MPDPRLVSRAQRAATLLERAWDRWRTTQGVVAEPLPPVSSYVGYSIEEPWGRPRVVFGVDAEDAERLAALLLRSAVPSFDAGAAVPGDDQAAGNPRYPGRTPEHSVLGDVRARIPMQGRTSEVMDASEELTGPVQMEPDGVAGALADGPAGGVAGALADGPAGGERPAGGEGEAGLEDQAAVGEEAPGPAQVADRDGTDPAEEDSVRAGFPVADAAVVEAAGGDAAAALAEDVTGHDGDAAEDGAAGQDGSSAGGESPTLRARAAGDSRRAGRRVTDTMAAELAGWAAGELPGQAAARLASWAAVGGLTGRGSAEADLRSGGSAAESVM